jgi:hypothetical protein
MVEKGKLMGVAELLDEVSRIAGYSVPVLEEEAIE